MSIQKKRLNKDNGFTLIEIMVVTGMMIVLSVVSVNIFFAILRASIKAEIIKNAKQEGSYALSVMERMIRNARKINGDCASDMTTLEILNPDNQVSTFTFSGNTIASSSGSPTVNLISYPNDPAKNYTISSYGFDCSQNSETSNLPVVTISFSLGKGVASLRAEDKVNLNFKTTVTLRNPED